MHRKHNMRQGMFGALHEATCRTKYAPRVMSPDDPENHLGAEATAELAGRNVLTVDCMLAAYLDVRLNADKIEGGEQDVTAQDEFHIGCI